MPNGFFGQNFQVENRKSEHHHWILHIRSSLGTKFQVKLTVFIFWPKLHKKVSFWAKFTEKTYFQTKTEKVNITIEFCIFEFWDSICPKRLFLVENRESELHYWVMQVEISLGTKFHLKLMILIFWTKFARKGYSRSKTEKVIIMIW